MRSQSYGAVAAKATKVIFKNQQWTIENSSIRRVQHQVFCALVGIDFLEEE